MAARAIRASVASAGARREIARRRGSSPRRLGSVAAAVLTLSVAAVGCSGGNAAPDRLVDGSKALTPPVELEDVSLPTVLTAVRLTDPEDVDAGSRLAACVRRRQPARPAAPLVERLGVTSETVTFRDSSSRWLHACDDVGPRRGDDRWCGGVSGRLYGGRLRDPRLSMAACTSPDGGPAGFAWVQPGADSRYLVVEHEEYAEAYEVAAGLPVRIVTTRGVIVDESRATFELSEHDAEGRLLRRYVLEASVAG